MAYVISYLRGYTRRNCKNISLNIIVGTSMCDAARNMLPSNGAVKWDKYT